MTRQRWGRFGGQLDGALEARLAALALAPQEAQRLLETAWDEAGERTFEAVVRAVERMVRAGRRTTAPGKRARGGSATGVTARRAPGARASTEALRPPRAAILRLAGDEPTAEASGASVDLALRWSSGRPLPTEARHAMEAFFGQSFADVGIHTDDAADAAAEAVGARAFTVGDQIYFRRGGFAPDTAAGRDLLAHELSHVLQWRRGDVAAAGADHAVSQPGDALEQEATQIAAAFTSGGAIDAFLRGPTPARRADTDGRDGAGDRAAPHGDRSTALAEAAGRATPARAHAVLRAPGPEGKPVTSIPAGGRPVQKVGLVARDRAPWLKLRSSPQTASDANVIRELPFNTQLQVVKAMPGDWLFVSLPNGEMGYVAAAYVKTDLPEPNALLHRVEPGVAGTAIAIAEHYYKAYADDWGQDLRFYVNVIARVNKLAVPDTTGGWKSVHFDAGTFLWIPSHAFARSLKGKVNSGSITYNVADAFGVAELIERIGELIEDFGTAIRLAGKYIPEAIARHAEKALVEALVGLAVMLVGAMLLTALLAAGGAIIGGPTGAAIGAKLALAILHWLGIGMLIVWVGASIVKIGGAFADFVVKVWNARGDQKKLDTAGRQLAEALGTLVGVLIEAIIMFAAAKGGGRALAALKNTRFGRAIGEAKLSELFKRKKPAAPGAGRVTVKPNKWDYFFGRVKSNPHNEARSLQNLRELKRLGIDEAAGGREKLMALFERGLELPEAGRHVTEHGVTITRTVEVGDVGAIDVKYFYPKGDLTAVPEVSTIIPKIFK